MSHHIDLSNNHQNEKHKGSEVGTLFNLVKYPGEEWRSFVSRRSRLACKLIEDRGSWWARLWMLHTISRSKHLDRDFNVQRSFFKSPPGTKCAASEFPTRLSWAPPLNKFQDEKWFAERRTFESRSRLLDSTTSRTRTRSRRGAVLVRWHDRISFCNRMVG